MLAALRDVRHGPGPRVPARVVLLALAALQKFIIIIIIVIIITIIITTLIHIITVISVGTYIHTHVHARTHPQGTPLPGCT